MPIALLLAGLVTALPYSSALALDPPVQSPTAQPLAPQLAEDDGIFQIMPLGDSITAGWTPEYGETDEDKRDNWPLMYGYRAYLDDLLTDDDWSFDFVGSQLNGPPMRYDRNNEGHPGWKASHQYTETDVLDNTYDWLDQAHLQTGVPVDIVLLHIGTNDFSFKDYPCKGCQPDPLDSGLHVAQEVGQILDEIKRFDMANGTDIRVILARIIDRRDDHDKSERTKHYNEELQYEANRRIAAGDNITVVNMQPRLDYPIGFAPQPAHRDKVCSVAGTDMSDCWHPNDPGYQKMAQVWYERLSYECTGDGVYLYRHSDYGGRCLKFTADEKDLFPLALNDMASSISFVGSYGGGNYVAKVYEHVDYQGASTVFGANDPNFGDDAIRHDRASSIQITEVPPSPCTGDGIYLYEHARYRGRCRKFTADEQDLLPLAFNDIASSIKFVGTFGAGRKVATLYEHIDFEGASTGFTANDPDFQDDEIKHDRASSIRIESSPPPTVAAIVPNSGQNSGPVQITNLAGDNFQAGATVKLTKSGQTAIQATDVSVVSASKITCRFDLNGAATGKWSVVVRNPDEQSGQLANGFTVIGFEGRERLYLPIVTQ